jgi:hypothetical protein
VEPSISRQSWDRRVESLVLVLAGTIVLAWLAFLLWMASGLLGL